MPSIGPLVLSLFDFGGEWSPCWGKLGGMALAPSKKWYGR